MSGIYWSPGEAEVKDYSALTKKGTTVITIKLVVSDPYALSHILRNLDEAQQGTAPAAPTQKTSRGKAALGHDRPLLLTDQRGGLK